MFPSAPAAAGTSRVAVLAAYYIAIVSAVNQGERGTPAGVLDVPMAGPNTVCSPIATLCNDSFSGTGRGCCVLPDAVCCQTPLQGLHDVSEEEGTGRNYCCPKGSSCSTNGCTPQKATYPCGPTQGHDCKQSFVCAPGPLPFTRQNGEPVVLVIGDSVSIGWTPVLTKLLAKNNQSFVTHSPHSGDGGARSTSDMLQCMDYRVATSTMEPLNLEATDTVVFNFGLHDYNQGLDGATLYEQELRQIVTLLKKRLGPAKLLFLNTSPAHNTINPMDNPTVVKLNERAAVVMKDSNVPLVDIYTPIMAQCGPVPFIDQGPKNCSLCSPHCGALSVHYTATGYNFFAQKISAALKQSA